MRPTKIWANLGVKDVAKTIEFYKRLGFKPNGGYDKGNELTSFQFGNDDFVINFFQEDALKKALMSDVADLTKGNEIMFTLLAESEDEANAWAEEVRKVGGTIFSEPTAFGENYYGFGFSDPDGHKFNVFHM